MDKISEELKKNIHIWAEGSQELEELLKTCYEYDLKTLYCCKGHKEKNKTPYLVLSFDNNKQEVLKKLALNTLKKDNGSLTFSYNGKSSKIVLYNLNFKECSNIIKKTEVNKHKLKIQKGITKETEETTEEKIIKIAFRNQQNNVRIMANVSKEDKWNLNFFCTFSEKNINKYDEHIKKIEKLPNFEVYGFDGDVEGVRYYSKGYNFYFSSIEELYNFMLKYEIEIFNK